MGIDYLIAGLIWLALAAVVGLIAGRLIHQGNPMDEGEERRRD